MFGKLFRSRRRNPALTSDGRLDSDLWIDEPDALETVSARERTGELDQALAAELRRFVEHGYMTFSVKVGSTLYEQLEADVERAWTELPFDLAYAYRSPLRLLAFADPARDRQPSCRLADLHSYSDAALALYLDSTVFAAVEAIFGEPAVATQSLYFQWGSQQALHRDPVHVHVSPPAHLLAAWIALEGIGPDCGPLVYVPGSHRLPYWQDATGDYRLHQGSHGEAEVREAAAFDAEQCRRRQLSTRPFTCRRGDVLIWHHSLLHGGSVPVDPSLTRKSFVVHFTTQRHCTRVRQAVLEEVTGPDGTMTERTHAFGTDRLLERERTRGFDNPLRGYRGPGARQTTPQPAAQT